MERMGGFGRSNRDALMRGYDYGGGYDSSDSDRRPPYGGGGSGVYGHHNNRMVYGQPQPMYGNQFGGGS